MKKKTSRTKTMSQALLQQSKDGVWLHRHEEVGAALHIPAGHWVCVLGMHDTDLTSCLGLRWSWCDVSSKTHLVKVKQSLDMILSTYPALSDIGYSGWKDLVVKYFIPLADAAQEQPPTASAGSAA